MSQYEVVTLMQVRAKEPGRGLLPVEEFTVELTLPFGYETSQDAQLLARAKGQYHHDLEIKQHYMPHLRQLLNAHEEWWIDGVIYTVKPKAQ